MPILRSTGATPKESAIWGKAVAITVPSSCSMNSAPATRRAMTALCRNDFSIRGRNTKEGGRKVQDLICFVFHLGRQFRLPTHCLGSDLVCTPPGVGRPLPAPPEEQHRLPTSH